MSEIRQHQNEARAVRETLRQSEETLYTLKNQLRNKKDQLDLAKRRGESGIEEAQSLQDQINTIEAQLEKVTNSFKKAKVALGDELLAFPDFDRPWELVKQLSDNLPFLLIPLRIETRYMNMKGTSELWVRIFPDDIAVHTHEKTLTLDERNSGETLWKEIWKATQESSQEDKEKMEKGAWRTISEAYGSTRAAWIAQQTVPELFDVETIDDLKFPAHDFNSLKRESWSRAPRSYIMPDRFAVMAYAGGKEVYRKLGEPIPDPLILGPDPLSQGREFEQKDGELLVGEDFDWIYDFDKAIQMGMGMKIQLEPPYSTRGFDYLLVMGLRLSSDEFENQMLLEELLENHHYSPDGLAFIPQGAPTNNTDVKGSWYSSQGPDAETSFAIEMGGPLFTPSSNPIEISDAQRLSDALGISYEPFLHVFGAGQKDVSEAIAINKALWHGTLGYYLEEMIGLDLKTVHSTREFFVNYVTGRGPLPAIRVGTQPYGVLLTSDFSRWQWSTSEGRAELPYLKGLYDLMNKVSGKWQEFASSVAHVGASGDPYQNLLSMLGLHATSVDFHRRNAVGKKYIWNYETFNIGTFFGRLMMELIDKQAKELLQDTGLDLDPMPRIFDLAFFLTQDVLTDPLIDDIPPGEKEKLSETKLLKSVYRIAHPIVSIVPTQNNYIAWLVYSAFDDIKLQRFENQAKEKQPVPTALLYRMLRGALIQAYYDASMNLYLAFEVLPPSTRQEQEFINIGKERTVTRWEFMEADVSQVLPQISTGSKTVSNYLQTDAGLNRIESRSLRETRESLGALVNVPTARLERIFAEHIDLCNYRLDAWQMGLFNRRLQLQRQAHRENGRNKGVYLGAFGWLEDLRPGQVLNPIDLPSELTSLHDPRQDGALYEQPGNGGFIHGPSLNHAVTAAVLRNAYITHYDAANPEKMAINLSSERVRIALAFLEGIRNGQELGALLGYQFERGLHDRYGDPSLNQYIPLIRKEYPLIADKITQDPSGAQIETKEARNVLDGYALLEAAVLKTTPLQYPYGVAGLPPNLDHAHAKAIQKEISRMADSLDAIKDLAMAEGVYQVTQGNYDRAGAMLKAFTEGNNPPEPDIVKTPRSGAAITQKVALHLKTDSGTTAPWTTQLTPRASVESGLNHWLGGLLPPVDKIQYRVRLDGGSPQEQDIGTLNLQPIDLLYLVDDDYASETTELETRIADFNRRTLNDDTLTVEIEFMASLADTSAVSMFELLPLLRNLRDLVTSARPLAADDYALESETTTNPEEESNPKGWDLSDLEMRMSAVKSDFDTALADLGNAIPPLDAEGNPDLSLANPDAIRDALKLLANFGIPDAFPHSATGTADEIKKEMVDQAVNIKKAVDNLHSDAIKNLDIARNTSKSVEQRVEGYREAARNILGSTFNLIPRFSLKNVAEVQSALNFREAPADQNLTRHHQSNPLIVEEWWQGVSSVREAVSNFDAIDIFGQILAGVQQNKKPLQLPFRSNDYWVAVEYPEVKPADLDQPDVFVPVGEFTSILQILTEGSFSPNQLQSGLLVDEWNEVIPGKQETTGIAVHYNQPNTEPPQSLLIAITPQITGSWTWDKLVGILLDTLARAKQRAVEPDQYSKTGYAHLLPAVLSAVTSYPYATISTDFIHQTAIQAIVQPSDDG